MMTFSSIHAFNASHASRFGLRRATCLSNGMENGGGWGDNSGGKKSVKETALNVLRRGNGDGFGATEWVEKTAADGNFSKGGVWRVVSQLIREHMRHGIIWTPNSPDSARGKYSLKQPPQATESLADVVDKFAEEILEEQNGEFIKLANWIADTMERAASDMPGASFTRKNVHTRIYTRFIANEKVERGDRGMYRKKGSAPESDDASAIPDREKENRRNLEEDFYKPFAVYLRDVLLECDGAKSVGGTGGIKFGNKWENPDVVGIAVNREGGNVDYTELVSAEIKIAAHLWGLMEGFGQASAYLRFSHKVYLVIPKETSCELRLTELCHNSGIGLVTLDPDMDVENPPEEIFTLLTRARKQEPTLRELDKHLQILRDNGGRDDGKPSERFGIKENEE